MNTINEASKDIEKIRDALITLGITGDILFQRICRDISQSCMGAARSQLDFVDRILETGRPLNTRQKNKRLIARQQIEYQRSEQWRLSCEQAYELAAYEIRETCDDTDNVTVIMDVDETIIDNRPYNESLYQNGKLWPDGWIKHITNASPLFIPGVIRFLEKMFNRYPNIYILCVSSRDESLQSITEQQINTIGECARVIYDIICAGSDKWRYVNAAIEAEGGANGAVFIIDDDIPPKDIPPDSYHHICIPNVIYGSWET